jgi:dynein heavy chain
LEAVATRSLQPLALNSAVKSALADVCVSMHETVQSMCDRLWLEAGRRTYVTPTIFLELLEGLKDLLRDRGQRMKQGIERYHSGLDKLRKTKVRVNELQEEMEALAPVLATATEEANTLMAGLFLFLCSFYAFFTCTYRHTKGLGERQTMADAVREAVIEEEKECAINTAEAQAITDDCAQDLAKACIPAFND